MEEKTSEDRIYGALQEEKKKLRPNIFSRFTIALMRLVSSMSAMGYNRQTGGEKKKKKRFGIEKREKKNMSTKYKRSGEKKLEK